MTLDYQVFLDAANDIAADRGEFAIFLLVLRDEMVEVMSTSASSPTRERWDVLMSAPWLAPDRRAPLEYVAEKIKKRGGAATLQSIARLSAVPISHPIVKRVTEALRVPPPLNAPPVVVSAGGISLVEPSLIGPGIAKAILVTATKNPKSKRAGR